MKRFFFFMAAIGGLFTLANTTFGAPFALSSIVANHIGNAAFVTVGDLNGDGKPDLVSLDGNNTFTVATNAGNGTFVINGTYYVASYNAFGNSSEPVFAAIADINGDGKPDIITANYGTNTVTIFTNAGGGIFASNASYTVGNEPVEVVAQDINGDGKPDIITANIGDGTLTILTNSSGRFPASHTIPGIGLPYYSSRFYPQIFAVADINGDGKGDIIIALSAAGIFPGDSFEVLTNAGGGNFVSNAVYNVTVKALATADFNKDGKMDVAVLGNLGVTVFTNGVNGQLTVSQTITLPVLAGPAPDFPPPYQGGNYLYPQMVAADLDGDGYMDLVVNAGINFGNLNVDDLELLFNNGSGGTFSTNYLTAGAPGAAGITNSTGMYVPANVNNYFSFAVADVNGDGKPDFIGMDPNGIRVMTNVMSNVIGLAVPTNIVVNVSANYLAAVDLAATWTNWMGTLPTTNTPNPYGYPVFYLETTNVITNSTGYHLTSALSASTNALITVIVLDVPAITLLGPNPLTNYAGAYVDPGATVSDFDDPANIYTSGNLNANVPGNYTVTYAATNTRYGNSAVTNRTVVIVPVPSLGIASAAGNQTSLFWPASGATNYTIQMTTNLGSGQWVNVPANNFLTGVSVSNSAPSAFFRFAPQ